MEAVSGFRLHLLHSQSGPDLGIATFGTGNAGAASVLLSGIFVQQKGQDGYEIRRRFCDHQASDGCG
jgi:hypothetical protein